MFRRRRDVARLGRLLVARPSKTTARHDAETTDGGTVLIEASEPSNGSPSPRKPSKLAPSVGRSAGWRTIYAVDHSSASWQLHLQDPYTVHWTICTGWTIPLPAGR